MSSELKIVVNGQPHVVKAPADTPLLYVLRNELGLNGPRFGCGLAQCGACTVHLAAKRSGRASRRSRRLQSMSRTLHEEVRFSTTAVTSVDWLTYPIADIAEMPEEMDIVLVSNRPDVEANGAGEPSSRPTAAAIANAIYDATGLRLRRVPFTPERVLAAMRGLA